MNEGFLSRLLEQTTSLPQDSPPTDKALSIHLTKCVDRF
mgnify:CR=1 FL=1